MGTSDVDELAENCIVLGERNYETATLLVMGQAQRSLKIFEPDLRRGAYQSVALHEALRDFLQRDPLNKVTLILHDSQFLRVECPRLVELFRLYSHAVTIYLTDTRALVAQDAFVLADDEHYLHRFHVNQARFKYVLNDATAARYLHERFAELLEATASILSLTTLGL